MPHLSASKPYQYTAEIIDNVMRTNTLDFKLNLVVFMRQKCRNKPIICNVFFIISTEHLVCFGR